MFLLGGHNTIALHNTCEDSLLAAPVMMDLVILGRKERINQSHTPPHKQIEQVPITESDRRTCCDCDPEFVLLLAAPVVMDLVIFGRRERMNHSQRNSERHTQSNKPIEQMLTVIFCFASG